MAAKYPSIRSSCPCGRVASTDSGEVHAILKGKPLCMQWRRGTVRVTPARGPITCARCVKLQHINAGRYEPKRRRKAVRRRR